MTTRLATDSKLGLQLTCSSRQYQYGIEGQHRSISVQVADTDPEGYSEQTLHTARVSIPNGLPSISQAVIDSVISLQSSKGFVVTEDISSSGGASGREQTVLLVKNPNGNDDELVSKLEKAITSVEAVKKPVHTARQAPSL